MIRPKIGIYGRMNVGKSSLLNHITGQQAAIVSPQAGTTTDPVRRTFEIFDFAPVVFIDTAGYDDTQTEIGKLRVLKTMSTLTEVDMAIVVIDDELNDVDNDFISKLTCPYIVVRGFEVEGFDGSVIDAIKAALPLNSLIEPPFFGNRLRVGQCVILVCPIDSEAPSGRLILPQVQAIRAALDIGALAVVVQPNELEQAVKRYVPDLVVTDSQAFAEVAKKIPTGVELTSFSIMLAERKGDPERYRAGLDVLDELRNGDKILMVEHCTHQISCDDIGRVKIPTLLQKRLAVELFFEFTQNIATIDDISKYALIVQCGGCMTNRRAVMSNIEIAYRKCVPITNYGMLLRKVTVGW